MVWISILSLAAAAVSLLVCYLSIRQVKKKIQGTLDVLAEIKQGNGNRRVLAASSELTAPIAYEINDIVASYEKELASLRRAEEANKQLMTSLSHDVRTPLTTLIGYLDAVHKGVVTGREKDEYTEIARRKAYDLKEYIDALFDWFKLNSDEFMLKPEVVEAAELTRNLLIDWIPVLEDKQIAYNLEIPDQPIRVRLDTDAYGRILNNLVQNVVAHSQATEIGISVSRQDREMALLVWDNGVGMEKKDLQHIFERLYKCDQGRSQKGSGLGLAITHQLVEKMGGTITAASTPGKGTTFAVRFPLAE
ncbi:sensor histidine kinase KdpD [uncultured Subdoligranulum sp.]|uniref:sensor histidine kinase n=1 Tax=uncultured Subdoligranulum sp. TaxID=512298 RepID=UPI00261887A8|nr:HAMP domain-containing sensor histidine kinase [uncultured Subdoligranulum sp.]